MSSETIYLVSNTNSIRLPDNTLTSFTSLFDSDLSVKHDKQYYIALQDISIDDCINPHFLPAFEAIAPIICTTHLKIPEDKSISYQEYCGIPSQDKVYLQARNYEDWEDFSAAITDAQNSAWHNFQSPKSPSLWCKISEAGTNIPRYFMGVFKDSNSKEPVSNYADYTLFIYHPLVELLVPRRSDGANTFLNVITIDGFDFVGISGTNNGIFFKGTYYLSIEQKLDQIVHVEMSNIEPKLIDNVSMPILATFCLEGNRRFAPEESDRYKAFFHHFKHKQWHKITGKSLQSLHIRLLDNSFKQHTLCTGRATVCRVILAEEVLNMKQQFTLTVTSKPQPFFPTNTNSKFSTYLSQGLQFAPGQIWEMAILSLSIPCRYALKGFSRQELVVACTPLDKEGYEIPSDTRTIVFDTIQTISDITSKINSVYPGGELVASVNQRTGTIRIESPVIDFNLIFAASFFKFLGSPSTDDTDATQPYVKIVRKKNTPLIFPSQPQFASRLPAHIWWYSSVIRPSLLGNQRLRILRIHQAKSKSYGDRSNSNVSMVHYEFSTLHFHEVESSTKQTLDFQLRDQVGDLISFNDSDLTTVVNLIFRRKK